MPKDPQKIAKGALAEEIAHNFLMTNGLSPIDRNYRTRFGEIDLISVSVQTSNTIRCRAGAE